MNLVTPLLLSPLAPLSPHLASPSGCPSGFLIPLLLPLNLLMLDRKEIWSKEDHVVIVFRTCSVIGPTGQSVSLPHALTGTVMHDEVESGQE